MATRRDSRRSRLKPSFRKQGGARASRRALLVAINDYGSPQNDLPSCLEDAAQFRAMLQSRYGFDDLPIDAAARIAGEVVPAVVGQLAPEKIYPPAQMPCPRPATLPAGANRGGSNRRYAIAQ